MKLTVKIQGKVHKSMAQKSRRDSRTKFWSFESKSISNECSEWRKVNLNSAESRAVIHFALHNHRKDQELVVRGASGIKG